MPGLVDALWALDLISGRLAAVGVDFLLAGPVSLWLQGARGSVEPLFMILVSSRLGNPERARRALIVATREAPWPPEYEAIIRGRVVSVVHRDGWKAAVAADPEVAMADGRIVRFSVAEAARDAPLVVVGRRPVRLARPGVELLLRGELEVGEEG